jgi:leucyl aminopeptidase (aminopeptidase T)
MRLDSPTYKEDMMNDRRQPFSFQSPDNLDDLIPGARRIAAICAGIKAGEQVVILTDTARSPRIAAALARVTAELGAIPLVTTMPPLPSGTEPPAPVAVALAAADVILAPTSGAIYHTAAIRRAAEAGARLVSLTEFTEDVLRTGGVFADFPRLAPRARQLAARLTEANTARVTTSAGTDLTVRLDGRAAIPITGLALEPGDRSACPDIEAFIAPLETSAEGVVVVDASASFVGVLDEPIRLIFQGGRAVAVEGGPAARQVRDFLAQAGTPAAYILAELAFGLNPAGIIRGVIVEDEGVAGTGHVALGSNNFFGGNNAAPLHMDFVYHNPTLVLDGCTMIREGELDLAVIDERAS